MLTVAQAIMRPTHRGRGKGDGVVIMEGYSRECKVEALKELRTKIKNEINKAEVDRQKDGL